MARLLISPLFGKLSEKDNRKSRTFAAMLLPVLVLTFAFVAYLAVQPFAETHFSTAAGLGACLLLFVAYLLARSSYYRWAVWLYITAINTSIPLSLILYPAADKTISMIPYMAGSVIIGGLLLSWAETIAISLLTLALSSYVMFSTLPAGYHTSSVRILFFIANACMIVVVAKRYFSMLENQKEKALQEAARRQLRLEMAQSLETISRLSTIGEFTTGIAHEIKNPLTVISGNASIIERMVERGDDDKEKILEKVRRIDENVLRITKIIRNIEQLVRGSARDPFTKADLDKIVRNACDILQDKAQKRHVAVRVLNKKPVWVECREMDILQVITNLLSNALDAACEQKDRWVQIEFKFIGETVQVCVTDSGPGIPEELHDKILQPFFTTKPVGQGTGIGLALARRMIEAHRGSLSIDKEHRHTRFVIALPLRQVPEIANTPAA